MSYLLGTVPGALIASGIFPDMHQQSAPFWDTGKNAYFREGKVGPLPPWTAVDTLSSTPVITGMKELDNRVASANGLVVGTRTKLFLWTSGSAVEKGSGYAGNADQSATVVASRWSFEQWGSWIIATDGVAVPQIYKGSTFGALGGVNFTTAEIFIKWRSFLLAFNTSVSATGFKWCSDDDPETWTPSGANSAGSQNVRDVSGPITAASYLGENVVFFGADSMHAVQWVEAPNYFGHKRLLKGIGAWSKNAVQPLGDGRLIGYGPRGVWTTDGTRIDYVDSPSVRKFMTDKLNQAQASKVVLSYDLQTHLVSIFFPVTGSGSNECTEGVVYNLESKQWSPLDFGRSAATDGAIFNYTFTGTSAGVIRKTGATGTYEAITLETKFTDLGAFSPDDPKMATGEKLIDAVRLEVGDATLTNTNLYIGTKAHWKDVAVWSGPYAVSGLDTLLNARPPESRLVALRILDATPLEMWQLTGMQIYGALMGARRG